MPPAATLAARPLRMLENAATGAAHAHVPERGLMALSDPFGTMAARPGAVARAATGRQATQAIRTPTPMPARPNPTPAPHLNSGVASSPANHALPGYQQHDRRLYDVQQRLQARGNLTPERQRLLAAVTSERKSLGNEMMQRAADPEAVQNQLRQGRDIALGRGGLNDADMRELSMRAAAPRNRQMPLSLNSRLPAFDMASYNKTAPFQGEHAGARTIAETIGSERMRNQLIPQAIAPKLGAWRKLGSWAQPVSNALKAVARKAHDRPDLADAAVRAGDKALLHGLFGTALGAAGGAIITPPGTEGDGALRGALVGGLGGAVMGGGLGWRDARALPVNAQRFNALRGAASKLQGALRSA